MADVDSLVVKIVNGLAKVFDISVVFVEPLLAGLQNVVASSIAIWQQYEPEIAPKLPPDQRVVNSKQNRK